MRLAPITRVQGRPRLLGGTGLGGRLVVAAGTAVGIHRLFDGLVPAEVIEAYDRLLARNGCAKDQAETLVGGSGLVAALTGRGMAHIQPHSPADPAWLRPASPDLALLGVLADHQNRLARDQELLMDGHRRLADAQAQFGGTELDGYVTRVLLGRLPGHVDVAEVAVLEQVDGFG